MFRTFECFSVTRYSYLVCFPGVTNELEHHVRAEDAGEPGELRGVVLGDAGADDAHARRALHPAQHAARLVSELRAPLAAEPQLLEELTAHWRAT